MADIVNKDNSNSPLEWYDDSKVEPAPTGTQGPKVYPGLMGHKVFTTFSRVPNPNVESVTSPSKVFDFPNEVERRKRLLKKGIRPNGAA